VATHHPLEHTALARLGARAVAREDPAYPRGLCDLADAPPVVFVRGGPIPAWETMVALVGSRAASPYGVRQAGRLAGDLARLGLTVVSGLARGIDAASHRGALEAGGRTIAVLPSGLDDVTPRHHRELAEEIAARGALLSEIASGPPRYRADFVTRNRLIASLAAATVVVEAATRSGALSTAAAARRVGRPVLAVPGDLDRDTAAGCHALLRAGARLCTGAADVLAALPRQTKDSGAPADPAPGAAARLLEALEVEPRSIETLAAAARLDVAEALAELLALEWAGVVESRPGQRWARPPRPRR